MDLNAIGTGTCFRTKQGYVFEVMAKNELRDGIEAHVIAMSLDPSVFGVKALRARTIVEVD